MVMRVVRLGSPRIAGEGLRIGTVRRPPRGVPKAEFARRNWYDVWYPNLAPSVPAMPQNSVSGSADMRLPRLTTHAPAQPCPWPRAPRS